MHPCCLYSHSLNTSVGRFSSLTWHKLTQQELASFFCQINELKDSLEGSGCFKGSVKELGGEEAGRDSLQHAGCGMHGAVATSPGGAHPGQATGQPWVLSMLPPTGITTLFSAGCQAHSKWQWCKLDCTRCCHSWYGPVFMNVARGSDIAITC